jgi:hypothetical protein
MKTTCVEISVLLIDRANITNQVEGMLSKLTGKMGFVYLYPLNFLSKKRVSRCKRVLDGIFPLNLLVVSANYPFSPFFLGAYYLVRDR